ncbi:MAG: hypothetical protein K2M63_09405 [Muribaculaceae bacterium]|nr:hypothetical protein [Muribaculaceae bacterium]
MKVKAISYILLFVSLILLSGGCRRATSENPTLLHASHLLENEPDSITEAKQILDSMSPSSLNEGDRSLHTLLLVKADDKLYIPHTSDSLILMSVKYEEKHRKRGYYPEALHYAARVYSDLGDYPTATNYHEKSLEAIPLDKKYDQLRFRALYGLAWSLTVQFLYSSADSVAQQAIQLAIAKNDTLRQARFYELLGHIQLHQKKYSQAISSLNNAEKKYVDLSLPDTISIITQVAYTEAELGKIDEAVDKIKRIEPFVDSISKSLYLSMASLIYLKGGERQDAIKAAKKLLKIPDFENKIAAYRVLLDPGLEDLMDSDSSKILTREYARELALHYERRDSMQSLHQLSLYNYDLHDRNRIKAENKMMKWKSGVVIAIIVLLIVTIVFLIRERNNNRRTILLQKTILDLTDRLSQNVENNSIEEDAVLSDHTDTQQEKKYFRPQESEQLLSRLITLISENAPDIQLEVPLASSVIVRKFRDSIVKNELSSVDWQYLEQEVMKYSPDFRNNLSLLSNGKIEEAEYKVALLIRCHFRPSEIGYILNIRPGTVSSHRGNISKKIFGRNIGTRLIDRVIKSL